MRLDKDISFVAPFYNDRIQAECPEATTLGATRTIQSMSVPYPADEKITVFLVGKMNVKLSKCRSLRPNLEKRLLKASGIFSR